MEKECQSTCDSEVVVIQEISERVYELIDISEDDLPISTNPVSEGSENLESEIDARDQRVTFPTPLLNRLNSWAFLDLENLSQLQTYLENLLVVEEEGPKDMIENMDVNVLGDLPSVQERFSSVQEPFKISLPNVKSEEQAILMEENCNDFVSEKATSQSTKPSVLPSTITQENSILAHDCTGETVNIRNTPEQVSTPNNSQLNSASNLISKDIQRGPVKKTEIPCSTTDKNLEREDNQERFKNHVPALLSKKPQHPKVRVGECVSENIQRNSSIPLAKSALVNSNFAVSSASDQHSIPHAKRPRSFDSDSEIENFSDNSPKKLSVEEYRLRVGISPLDPRRKAVPLATKGHRVSSQTLNASHRGASPIYSQKGLTVAQPITSTRPSFQNRAYDAGTGQVFSQAAATNTFTHYVPLQYSTVFAGTAISSQNHRSIAYPMNPLYTAPQMAMLGDTTPCLIQLPMVQPFSQEQMANHGHWSIQNPMVQPFTTAQMPIPSDPHMAFQYPMDQ